MLRICWGSPVFPSGAWELFLRIRTGIGLHFSLDSVDTYKTALAFQGGFFFGYELYLSLWCLPGNSCV